MDSPSKPLAPNTTDSLIKDSLENLEQTPAMREQANAILESLEPIEDLALIHIFDLAEITVEQVHQLIKTNPKHPNSKIFYQAVRGMAPGQKVQLQKADIIAVAHNVESLVKEERGPGYIEISKQTGEPITDKPLVL